MYEYVLQLSERNRPDLGTSLVRFRVIEEAKPEVNQALVTSNIETGMEIVPETLYY